MFHAIHASSTLQTLLALYSIRIFDPRISTLLALFARFAILEEDLGHHCISDGEITISQESFRPKSMHDFFRPMWVGRILPSVLSIEYSIVLNTNVWLNKPQTAHIQVRTKAKIQTYHINLDQNHKTRYHRTGGYVIKYMHGTVVVN